MSVTFPTRMQFFRFAPSTGALPEIIAGLIFGSLPGLLLVYVWRAAAGHAIWAVPLILIGCVTLYFFTAIWS